MTFFFVYTREAHPVKEGKAPETGPRTPKDIARAASLQDRAQAAADCLRTLRLPMPVLLDTMDAQAWNAYHVHQASTVVIDRAGRIRFHTTGPGGTQPKEAEKVLRSLLGGETAGAGGPSRGPAGGAPPAGGPAEPSGR